MRPGSLPGVLATIAVLAAVAVTALHWSRIEPRLLPPDAVLPDGGEYHGETRAGRFHGQGTLVWPNGARYEGRFAEGLFEGEGRYWSSTGQVYEGEFQQGQFHGQGRATMPTGAVYEGRFRDGEIVRGIHHDGHGNEYEGEFDDWQFHGEGVFTTAGGDVYRGTFERGKLTGEGVHETAAGAVYEGEFRNWTYHGSGTLTEADGTRYVGEFVGGFRHGEGRLENADGKPLQVGTWSWGEFQGADGRDHERRAEALERALYRQVELLRAELDGVAPGRPGRIDLYFVGVAPYGGQNVFRREIEFIAEQFARDYGTPARTVVLGNHPDTLDSRPLATRTSIERALVHVASLMDPEEDILFLYVTTHGSEDHELAIEQPGLELPDLDAATLAELLNDLPVRWRIIAISVCYSGGYLPALEGERTLVMTAARADRTSFGCGDDSDMTYFGKAYFREALPQAESFRDAFERARALIREWEERDGAERHSEPQIALGAALAEHLAAWRRERGAE